MTSPEVLVRELVGLAGKKPLKGELLEKAKQNMRALRQNAFTVNEIYDMVKKTWSLPTIKLYTRGAMVIDEASRKEIAKLVSDMAYNNVPIEDIPYGIAIDLELSNHKVGREDVASLIEAADEAGIDLPSLIETHKKIVSSGMNLAQIRETLQYKESLKKAGIDKEALQGISKAAAAYGSLKEVMEAISAYGNIDSIKRELQNVKATLEDKKSEKEKLGSEVKGLEEKRGSLGKEIDLYNSVRDMGFGHKELSQLSNMLSSMGGTRKVFEAIEKYRSLFDIENEIVEITRKKEELEAKLTQKRAEWAHLESIMQVCKKLLYDLKFSTSAIQNIYDVAKRYGEPVDVLKAIEAYGTIKSLEEKIVELGKEKISWEMVCNTLRGQANNLKAQIEANEQAFKGITNKLVRDMSTAYIQGIEEITNTYQTKVVQIERDTERYIEIQKRAISLEEELKLAKLVYAVYKYPMEVPDIPLRQGIIFVKAASGFFKAKMVNPHMAPSEDLKRTYPALLSVPPITATALLDWAAESLETEEVRGAGVVR